VLKSNIAIILTLVFKWCMVRCKSKNEDQKDVCFKEIGLCAQNMPTNLGLIIIIIFLGEEDLFDHLTNTGSSL
jgi:hypothetical protein